MEAFNHTVRTNSERGKNIMLEDFVLCNKNIMFVLHNKYKYEIC